MNFGFEHRNDIVSGLCFRKRIPSQLEGESVKVGNSAEGGGFCHSSRKDRGPTEPGRRQQGGGSRPGALMGMSCSARAAKTKCHSWGDNRHSSCTVWEAGVSQIKELANVVLEDCLLGVQIAAFFVVHHTSSGVLFSCEDTKAMTGLQPPSLI